MHPQAKQHRDDGQQVAEAGKDEGGPVPECQGQQAVLTPELGLRSAGRCIPIVLRCLVGGTVMAARQN